MVIAPTISAITALGGMPSVSSGMNEVCEPALLALSGPATPWIAPLPKREGSFASFFSTVYDAKAEGFLPGGASLHNCMTGHGPDAETFEKASTADLAQPTRIADTMAFMFETRFPQKVTAWAAESDVKQDQYAGYGRHLKKHFDPNRR